METRFITASDFNRIKLFEDQDHHISKSDLRSLAELYISYGLHKAYGVGILHRHFALEEEHVLVHEMLDGEIDICRPWPVRSTQSRGLHVNSVFLNGDLFQCYEYGTNLIQPMLQPTFLHCLREILVRKGLQDKIAIIPRPDSKDDCQEFIEENVPEKKTMRTYPKTTSCDITGISITTGWTFDQHGDIKINAIKKCTTTPTGLHKVTHDSQY